MQEMTIEVDEEFIYTLIDFIGSSTAGQQATIESFVLLDAHMSVSSR